MFCLIDYNFVLQFLFKTSSACLIQHKSEHEIQIATSLEVGVDLKPLVVRGVGLLEPTCQGATSRVGLVVHPTLIRALCPEPTVSNLDDFPVVFTEPFPFGCPLREQSKWFRSHPSLLHDEPVQWADGAKVGLESRVSIVLDGRVEPIGSWVMNSTWAETDVVLRPRAAPSLVSMKLVAASNKLRTRPSLVNGNTPVLLRRYTRSMHTELRSSIPLNSDHNLRSILS